MAFRSRDPRSILACDFLFYAVTLVRANKERVFLLLAADLPANPQLRTVETGALFIGIVLANREVTAIIGSFARWTSYSCRPFLISSDPISTYPELPHRRTKSAKEKEQTQCCEKDCERENEP